MGRGGIKTESSPLLPSSPFDPRNLKSRYKKERRQRTEKNNKSLEEKKFLKKLEWEGIRLVISHSFLFWDLMVLPVKFS